MNCGPCDGITDSGSAVGNFDCAVPLSLGWPPVAPGPYRIGTIVWDTSRFGVVDAGWKYEVAVSAAYIDGSPGAFIAVRNGNIVEVTSEVVLGSHIIQIILGPGTAALLGLGLVGFTVAARRGRG